MWQWGLKTMCGIAGVLGVRDEQTVKAMLAALHHRGPDDRHFVAGDSYTLGATRLSILDLAGGRQPMTNEAGDVVAAQNGELYNVEFATIPNVKDPVKAARKP